jgi:hypothetical protein
MRALLILMAILPPAGFVSYLFAQLHPVLALLPLAWCAAFVDVVRHPQTETLLGLTHAELLVLVAIAVVLGVLLYDPVFLHGNRA